MKYFLKTLTIQGGVSGFALVAALGTETISHKLLDKIVKENP